MSTFLPLTLSLLGVGAAVAVAQVSYPSPPSREQWRAVLSSTVAEAVPPSARACGFVALGQDPSVAQACISSAESAGEAFWVASQGVGEDSLVWAVVLRGADGALSQVDLDSIGWQDRGGPSFGMDRRTCLALKPVPRPIAGHAIAVEPAFTCS